MKESVLKQIRENLSKCGFEVYYPTQHTGECLKEYVVVAYSGSTEYAGTSSVMDTYEIMCYVPKNRYSSLIEYVENVRDSMRNIFPLVRETGTQTTSYYDESVNGHMLSIEYVNYRKLKFRR